jgi:MOSC domain-containing protein YiiM
MPSVLSVNVGGVRHIEWHGETISTGIWKQPVSGRVPVHGVNLDGDDQADRTVHGGPDKAVYAYASEDYTWWREHSNVATAPALFGENLTTEGLDLSSAVVGELWAVGSTLLEVAQPRLPCYKLGIRVGDASFLRTFLVAGRLGAYLRIVREGDVGAGDSIDVRDKPAHGVTLRDMAESLDDPSKRGMLQRVSSLPAFWRKVAARTAP